MKIFLIVLAAIVVAALVLFPSALPSGLGIRPMPITAKFRASVLALGQGSVLQITNTKSEPFLNVTVYCRSNGGKSKSYFIEKLGSEATYEIGPVQGWIWLTDEEYKITAPGYLPVSGRSP